MASVSASRLFSVEVLGEGEVAPSSVGLSSTLPERISRLVEAAILDGCTPGAAVAVLRHGRLVLLRGYGKLSWAPDASAVSATSTLFDLASLTKVVAATTVAMMLEDDGLLDLSRPVALYLPELAQSDSAKAAITVRQLLVHRAGFEAFAPLYERCRGRDAYLAAIAERPLLHAPETATVYSDWDFILLQLVLERITGMPLDRLVHERLTLPLGLGDTLYTPSEGERTRVAPTEEVAWRGGLVHGIVHDENAMALGGVSGHAGLFSTARDLAVFAQMLLQGGRYDGVRLVQAATVARWTARQSGHSSRALGWDTPSPLSSAGRYFSPRSFGHTGFTGTSIWIDPERQLALIVLANRVHPTRDNAKMPPLRRALADAVQEAVEDAPLIDWETRLADDAAEVLRRQHRSEVTSTLK